MNNRVSKIDSILSTLESKQNLALLGRNLQMAFGDEYASTLIFKDLLTQLDSIKVPTLEDSEIIISELLANNDIKDGYRSPYYAGADGAVRAVYAAHSRP